MRRTYRSKKETSGALDHKDVLLNMDEKSSVFDAFYIQNIKHTKREMSTMHLHAGSSKVRKRKYVKRIVKDVEPIHQESALESVYLTPNKSLHVNKPLDPFDQLLNSSSSTRNYSPSKDAIFGGIQKKGKTYSKRKLAKIKKYNYSSSISSESDKENSKDETQDISNIKMHQLLIEKYDKESPKHFDRSINDLVQNFCVLKKSNIKNTSRGSSGSNFNRNRLTTNIQSPILQSSPLCSTPFKEKYRGQSIYKFSPIKFTSNLNNSPNFMNTSDNKDNNTMRFVKTSIHKFPNILENDSLYNDNKNVIDEFKTSSPPLILIEGQNAPPAVTETSDNHTNSQITSETCKNVSNIVANHSHSLCEERSITEMSIINVIDKERCENCEDVNDLQNAKENSDKSISKHGNSGHEEELLKNSIVDNDRQGGNFVHEVELSNAISTGDKEIHKNYEGDSIQDSHEKSDTHVISSIELSSLQTTELEPFLGFLGINQDTPLHEEIDPINNDSEISVNVSEGNVIGNESDRENSVDSEINESRTSLSNKSLDKSIILGKVNVKKSVDANITLNTNDSKISYKVSSNGQSDDSSLSSHDESTYDTCDSGQSSQNTSELMFTKKPIVVLEKMDDSLFHRYCARMVDYETEVSNTSYPDSESYASFNDSTSENLSNKSTNDIIENSNSGIEENIDLNTSSEITDENDTETDSNSITEEDRCISFVTTRRRNEVTNDSMILDFSDSYDSKSSLDCDKTVLSNNKVSMQKSDLAVNVEEETLVNNSSDTVLAVEDAAQYLNSEASVSNVMSRTSVGITESSKTINSLDPLKMMTQETKPSIVLQPGKKWERSLSIFKRMTMMGDHFDNSILDDEPMHLKGRKYRESVISTMEMQDSRDSLHNDSFNSRRSFVSKPCRSTIKIVKEPNSSRLSLSSTTVVEDLRGFLHEDCDDTIVELSKLSIVDSEHEVTVLENFHDTAGRVATARDYVLRRCNQTDSILFDECYPDTVLKNCHKIGEGVYGEVYLWRAGDGRVRVMKIVPIAGTTKVNGEHQKDFHEIISEIVIAMELSALRAPIADIERHLDEGKDIDALDLHTIQNATDVFNEVLAVRCVYGSYPSRLLDLWELFDETRGSENDNPAILPLDQQYIVLELANAGQDLESYQFNSAEQAHALFLQVAFGLAVGEESFQFEHRDLHWGNVLIAPTDQKFAVFVVRGRAHRVPRCGVAATIIDYSLSRLSLPLAATTPDAAALYNDLSEDDGLFDARGDYQFEVYRLMRDKLGNDWKNFEPYTNILWLHYTVDKMITALRYKRTNTKIHKHYIAKLKGIKNRILDYGSAVQFVLTDIEF